MAAYNHDQPLIRGENDYYMIPRVSLTRRTSRRAAPRSATTGDEASTTQVEQSARSPVESEPWLRAHELAHRINPDLVFTAHHFLQPTRKNLCKLLPICVRYVGPCASNECRAAVASPDLCPRCDICVHEYACNCRRKKDRTAWCAHLHAAVRFGGRKFYDARLVFVQRTTSTQELYHTRAVCLAEAGLDYCVRKFDDDYRAGFVTALFSVYDDDYGFRVERARHGPCPHCPNYRVCRVCRICYHTYDCGCDRVWRDAIGDVAGPICEHRHAFAMAAAMATGDHGDDLFDRPFEWMDDDSDDEPPTYLSPIEEDHQRAFLVDASRLAPCHHGANYAYVCLRADSHRRRDQAYLITRTDGRLVFNSCECRRTAGTALRDKCPACGICDGHYKCDLYDDDKRIGCHGEYCKHVQALLLHLRRRKYGGELEYYSDSETDLTTITVDDDRRANRAWMQPFRRVFGAVRDWLEKRQGARPRHQILAEERAIDLAARHPPRPPSSYDDNDDESHIYEEINGERTMQPRTAARRLLLLQQWARTERELRLRPRWTIAAYIPRVRRYVPAIRDDEYRAISVSVARLENEDILRASKAKLDEIFDF